MPIASEKSGLEEQVVLSSAVKWALADYTARHGEAPEQIVLHIDVNGTLAGFSANRYEAALAGAD